MFTRIGVSAVAVTALAAFGATSSPAQASATITQVSLINSPAVPYAGQNVTATLTVRSSACITVQALVVTARDSKGDNVGWGGNWNNPQICPSGFTLTPAARSFQAGTYAEYGSYLVNNTWVNLPTQVLNVTAPPATGRPEPSWAPNATHAVTFDDEFSGTSINTSKWSTGWWVYPSSNGLTHSGNTYMTACYDSAYDTEPGDGYLHMKLAAVPNTCGTSRNYTGAVLDSHGKFAQQNGEFEARVDIRCNASGYPYGWPAWWTIDSTWTGEIDDIEGGSIVGGTSSTLHYASGSPSYTSPSPACGWHTFGSAWSAQAVTFYWDGRQVLTHSFPVSSGHPEYLILDNQMCPHCVAPPAGGSVMLVDWVRAWSLAVRAWIAALARPRGAGSEPAPRWPAWPAAAHQVTAPNQPQRVLAHVRACPLSGGGSGIRTLTLRPGGFQGP